MSYNANHHKHYEKCLCPIHEHQSLLSCCDQYQPHQNICQHRSNSSQMHNTEPDVRDAGNAGIYVLVNLDSFHVCDLFLSFHGYNLHSLLAWAPFTFLWNSSSNLSVQVQGFVVDSICVFL